MCVCTCMFVYADLGVHACVSVHMCVYFEDLPGQYVYKCVHASVFASVSWCCVNRSREEGSLFLLLSDSESLLWLQS